ncbi:hypothetical protein KY311_04220 [Candidatus Woesearchaeota archaeon]|nr:hypothetical protein [Candidatus Woesearchaeota archaeon]MBW3017465.1 hypothetical protein [Candidatus Woesearchaeota archaeon]
MADDLFNVKDSIKAIKEELNDHLIAINESTDEIETNYSYLLDLTQRIEVIEKRLEDIQNLLSRFVNAKLEKSTKKIRIDEAAQEVFLALYESPRAIDYDEICVRLRKSEPFVRYCINRLIENGVPVKKHVINRKAYFILDTEFKELQAKKGIVAMQKTLTLDVFDQSIL